MEDPRQSSTSEKSESGGTAVAELKPLQSLEQFMADRPEDAWEHSAYEAYFKTLVKAYTAAANPPTEIKPQMKTAQTMIQQYNMTSPLNVALNAAYQGLCGPRPGDSLRKITPDFLVDGHQWKHYKNGDKKWGLFNCKWEEVHKIIQYGAKLILVEWANRIDQGAKVRDQLMDGYVEFDRNVGTPGDFVTKEVSLIKIQISRGGKLVSGHGYPVPSADNDDFPTVKGNHATALLETLTADNNSMRSKT